MNWSLIKCLFVVAVLTTIASGAQAETHPDESVPVLAKYRGTIFGFELDYGVEIRWQDYDPAALAWTQLTMDPVAGTRQIAFQDGAVHITLQRRLLGSSTITDVLFEPTRAAALQRIVRRERDDYISYKATQFGRHGIKVLRIRDYERTVDLQWADARSHFYPFPSWMVDQPAVADPSAIFHQLTYATLREPGDRMQLPVFSNDQLQLIEMTVEQRLGRDSEYTEVHGGKTREINEKRDALSITVATKHLDPDSPAEDMTVLGLQGDLRLEIDSEHRVPLIISGQAPKVGRVQLTLDHLAF